LRESVRTLMPRRRVGTRGAPQPARARRWLGLPHHAVRRSSTSSALSG